MDGGQGITTLPSLYICVAWLLLDLAYFCTFVSVQSISIVQEPYSNNLLAARLSCCCQAFKAFEIHCRVLQRDLALSLLFIRLRPTSDLSYLLTYLLPAICRYLHYCLSNVYNFSPSFPVLHFPRPAHRVRHNVASRALQPARRYRSA